MNVTRTGGIRQNTFFFIYYRFLYDHGFRPHAHNRSRSTWLKPHWLWLRIASFHHLAFEYVNSSSRLVYVYVQRTTNKRVFLILNTKVGSFVCFQVYHNCCSIFLCFIFQYLNVFLRRIVFIQLNDILQYGARIDVCCNVYKY